MIYVHGMLKNICMGIYQGRTLLEFFHRSFSWKSSWPNNLPEQREKHPAYPSSLNTTATLCLFH